MVPPLLVGQLQGLLTRQGMVRQRIKVVPMPRRRGTDYFELCESMRTRGLTPPTIGEYLKERQRGRAWKQKLKMVV